MTGTEDPFGAAGATGWNGDDDLGDGSAGRPGRSGSRARHETRFHDPHQVLGGLVGFTGPVDPQGAAAMAGRPADRQPGVAVPDRRHLIPREHGATVAVDDGERVGVDVGHPPQPVVAHESGQREPEGDPHEQEAEDQEEGAASGPGPRRRADRHPRWPPTRRSPAGRAAVRPATGSGRRERVPGWGWTTILLATVTPSCCHGRAQMALSTGGRSATGAECLTATGPVVARSSTPTGRCPRRSASERR